MLCIPCVLFSHSDKTKSNFVKAPGFSKWYKIKEKVEIHAKTAEHADSIETAEQFNKSFSAEAVTVKTLLDESIAARIAENRDILRHVIKVNINFQFNNLSPLGKIILVIQLKCLLQSLKSKITTLCTSSY